MDSMNTMMIPYSPRLGFQALGPLVISASRDFYWHNLYSVLNPSERYL